MNVNDFGPFDPNIWGHVSEWLMVIVTSLTAFYLYKTLKSQLEVQQIQNELLKLESLKLKESVKPLLKYSGSTDKFKSTDENQKILTID